MSIINKMLQDLDRRRAAPIGERIVDADATVAAPLIRPVTAPRRNRRWFWITLSVVLVATVAWAGWLRQQLLIAPVGTELAYKAADEARAKPAAAPLSTAAPASAPTVATPTVATMAPVGTAPSPAIRPPASGVGEPLSAPQLDMLRLAESIATPILEPKPAAEPASASKAASKRAAAAPAPVRLPPSTRFNVSEPAKASEKPKVERVDRTGTAAEGAENEFRQGVSALKLGRSGEAESHFVKALDIDHAHHGARQALIAMNLERGELERARRLLQDGLAIEPAQPDFAIALARILVERKDIAGALGVLDRSAPASGEVPEFHILRGTLLQRLGRHAEAAEEYQTALQVRPSLPQAWVGLGISLETLNRRPEALDAFRHALVAGPVTAEVKTFAEQRIRALR